MYKYYISTVPALCGTLYRINEMGIVESRLWNNVWIEVYSPLSIHVEIQNGMLVQCDRLGLVVK